MERYRCRLDGDTSRSFCGKKIRDRRTLVYIYEIVRVGKDRLGWNLSG